MSEINIEDFSFKVIRQSSHFFRSIWKPTNEMDIDTDVYRDYLITNKSNYVNDFVRKHLSKTSDLTSEQVLCIHEDNKAKAKEFNNDIRIGYDNPDRRDLNQVLTSIASNDLSSTDTSEMTPTNELLDMLQIPQGERQKRLEILERQSEIFFRYLCMQIGTPAIVKTRRFIYNHFAFLHIPVSKTYFQLIGSKSEGLDMSESDTDIMATTDLNAYERNNRPCFSISFLEYDSQIDKVPPGYVLLKIAGSNISFPSYQLHEMSYSLKKMFAKEAFTRERHGPAFMMTSLGRDFDIVVSVKSESWPQIATEWIFRKRCFGWPSEEMIISIVQEGCHIVPVGRSRDHAYDKEWRLSFCIAEKELVKTFNHTQLLVYGLLKIIFKEIISHHKNIENLICSYFLKTVLFWEMEESRRSFWVPNNIFLCFHLCFRRLIQFVVDENCPNYFVASINMFEGRFTSHSKEALLRILCELVSSERQGIFQCKSLNRFLNFKQGSKPQLQHLIIMAIENERVESLIILSKLVLQGRNVISLKLNGIGLINRYELNKFLKVPILRKKILPVFCHFMDINHCTGNNKDLYLCYIFQMMLFTMDLHDDIICGKTLLATWLYKQGKFQDCLRITHVAVKNLDLRICHNYDSRRDCHKFKQTLNCCRDVTDLHYFCSYDILFPLNSRLMLKEMMLHSNAIIALFHLHGIPFLFLYPEIYIYFLRSLCFHRIGDKHNSEIEYRHMISVNYICSDDSKSSFRISHIMMKICFNATRYDIIIDTTNISTVTRSIASRWQQLDLSKSDLCMIVNAQENMIKQGIDPAAVADLSDFQGSLGLLKYVLTNNVS